MHPGLDTSQKKNLGRFHKRMCVFSMNGHEYACFRLLSEVALEAYKKRQDNILLQAMYDWGRILHSGTKYTEADKYFYVNNPGVFHIIGFS